MEASKEECKFVCHPNKMVYTDDKGEHREIYMPARDFYKAMEHYKKQEWSELAKFPKWGMCFCYSVCFARVASSANE